MRENIRNILREKSDSDYKEFSASLIPGAKPLLGVRIPELRKLAQDLVKREDWRELVTSYDGDWEDIYFEETMLRGLVIGYGTKKANPQEGVRFLESFIPYINDWSVCDSFCNSFLIARKYQEIFWDCIETHIRSDKEFEVRVSVILMLNHFLKYNQKGKKAERKRMITLRDLEVNSQPENEKTFPNLKRIFKLLNKEFNQGYYAQMAVAWTLAESFVCFPYETMKFLQQGCKLDFWTYNKALQKICESKNTDMQVKNVLKSMKHL